MDFWEELIEHERYNIGQFLSPLALGLRQSILFNPLLRLPSTLRAFWKCATVTRNRSLAFFHHFLGFYAYALKIP